MRLLGAPGQAAVSQNNCDPEEAASEVTQVKHAAGFHGRMYDSGLCSFIRMSHFFLCVISESCLLRKLNWQPFIIIEARSSALFEVKQMHVIRHQACGKQMCTSSAFTVNVSTPESPIVRSALVTLKCLLLLERFSFEKLSTVRVFFTLAGVKEHNLQAKRMSNTAAVLKLQSQKQLEEKIQRRVLNFSFPAKVLSGA